MSQAKEISFNDYLKEGSLINENLPEEEVSAVKIEVRDLQLPSYEQAGEAEMKIYWRSLRHFFRSGEKPADYLSKSLTPALLADYIDQKNLPSEFPVLITGSGNVECVPVAVFIEERFNALFPEDEAKVLRTYLPRFVSYFKQPPEIKSTCVDLNSAVLEAITRLAKLKVHGEEGVQFNKDLQKFEAGLKEEGSLFWFSSQLPLDFISSVINSKVATGRKDFIENVIRLRSKINDLIVVEEQKRSGKDTKEGKSNVFDFASSIIEFGKLSDMMPESASEPMPESRLIRLNEVLADLSKAEDLFLNNSANIILGNAISNETAYSLESIFEGAEILVADEKELCTTAVSVFDRTIKLYVSVIAATRIAKLETEARFDEEVHPNFFRYFDWHNFTNEELQLCPPVILIDNSSNLMDVELASFSTLLASNKPIKVLALKKHKTFNIHLNGVPKDENFVFGQELAAFAISHRSAYTFQASVNSPVVLYNGIAAGLASSSPALFHILIPGESDATKTDSFLQLSTAVESRAFPQFTYDDTLGNKWGSRFDISANPQPESDWPSYSIDIKNSDHKPEAMKTSFSFADYFASEPVNNIQLMVVPPEYCTDELITIDHYLRLEGSELYAKIPFVWMVDAEGILQKAVIPYPLIINCKERLDFWNYIQELGGVNSFHVQKALEVSKRQAAEETEKAIGELKQKHIGELEEVRLNAAGDAMDKLAGILLDMDKLSTTPSPKSPDKTALESEKPELKAEATETPVAATEEVFTMGSEPWVDSIRCTTCNECTDKFPNAFKYNKEKLAVLENPSAATYAQLVAAAEECPAKCIHPGLPLNPNEKGVDELIKRAKAFN